MRILFIRTQNPFFESGADANRFAGLLKGLMEHDVKISMLITRGYNDFNELKQHGIPQGYNNLTVHYTNYVFNNNIWFRRFNSLVIEGLLRNINHRCLCKYLVEKYDYIWLTKDMDILREFNAISDNLKSKTLIELNEFHDIHKGVGAIGNSIQHKRADITERIFTAAIQKIDCFAIMTKTLMDHYRMMAKKDAKFVHIPMTVDLSRFQNVDAGKSYQKPYIAFTGTFNNAKDGVDILIQAFAKIAQKYPDYHLYLAGFWHYDVPMQEDLIEKFGLKDRITYLGVLNKDQIPEFVCNSSILVLSRPDSHQAQGGFPTKLGEYLATGKPVCVTKVGEIPNYLEDNKSAFMADPGDVNSFIDAMDRALSKPEESKAVGQSGKKVAETQFNLEIQSLSLYEFLSRNK